MLAEGARGDRFQTGLVGNARALRQDQPRALGAHVPREVEVCWRAGNEVGIRLLGEAASASEPVLAEKVRLAEETNAELVQRLREAQRQLEAAETRSHQANAGAGAAAHSAAAGRDRAFTYVPDDEARILVTDDDPILREFARVHLTTPSASVEVAESAKEGLACLKRAAFDIALIDLEMPGMGWARDDQAAAQRSTPLRFASRCRHRTRRHELH